MGSLLHINEHFEEENRNKTKKFFPFLCILILGCMIGLFLFSSLIDNKEIKYNFGYRTYVVFLRIATKSGFFTVIGFFSLIIALIREKEVLKPIFNRKCFYYIIIISIIDSLTYLVFHSLITEHTRAFIITEYFTSPIYLLYLILYYYIFKKVIFSFKQIIISYIFFLIGMSVMIIGLIKHF